MTDKHGLAKPNPENVYAYYLFQYNSLQFQGVVYENSWSCNLIFVFKCLHKSDNFTVPYWKYEGINRLIEEAVGPFKNTNTLHSDM